MPQFRNGLAHAALILFFCFGAHGQTTDNQLNTLGPVGVQPNSGTTGTTEQISLATGALNVMIPLLSLPQRGGWSLSLGYVHNSNLNHPVQNVSVYAGTTNLNGMVQPVEHTLHFTYIESWDSFSNLLEPTLPRLQASIEYNGAYRDIGDSLDVEGYHETFCRTNWIFTDWYGSAHTFKVNSSCSDKQGAYTAGAQSYAYADSLDGSFYLLDTSNPNEAVVSSMDGTQYHFPFSGSWDPYNNVPSGGVASATVNLVNDLDTREMTMVDPNGNKITVVDRADQKYIPITAWTLTDTLGRVVNIGQDGMTYLDANSTSAADLRTISLTSSPAAPLSQPMTYGSTGCINSDSNYTDVTYQIISAPAQTSAATTLLTLTLPPSDSSGNTRAYKLLFDPAKHLIRADYPTGGYSKYDFTDYEVPANNGPLECLVDMFQVTAKHVCSSASGSGSCGSGEETTTYTPGTLSNPGSYGTAPYNITAVETDPYNTKTTHTFRAPYYNPLETDVSVTAGTGRVLKTVHTEYTDSGSRTQLTFPKAVTITLGDSPDQSSYRTTTSYTNSYTSVTGETYKLSTPTEQDSYDFTGALIAKTTTSWQPASAFSVPHMLDRVDATIATDLAVTANASPNTSIVTTTHSYDSSGNLTLQQKTGNDGSFSSTKYGTYINGYPSSTTDALGNKTLFYYTDAFAAGPCAPSSNLGAYRTSVQAPDGSTTAYTYNACTGSVATMTDPNKNVTTYWYDALGRQTSATMPSGFARGTQYSDGVPNTVTTTTTATPDPALTSVATLDGLGRITSLTSGGVFTSTAYDSIGRVHSTSNPNTTTNTFDALNRLTSVAYADGTSSGVQYFGEYSIATDANGNIKVQQSNSQGSLTEVCEVAPAFPISGEQPSVCPSWPGQTSSAAYSGYLTTYVYDGRGNLNRVNARNQLRSFKYDSFSRLVTASNPESGSTCYGQLSSSSCAGGYDANGNLLYKTDAAGVLTSYHYDSLNRLTSKKYTDGTPSACFSYSPGATSTVTNGNGRLASSWTQVGACASGPTPGSILTQKNIVAYDVMGRVQSQTVCTPNSCTDAHPQIIAYDLAGQLSTYTDGLGAIVFTQTFDGNGRLASLQSSLVDATHPGNLFSAPSYDAAGLLENWTIGDVLGMTASYDTRSRISSFTVTAKGTSGVGTNSSTAANVTVTPKPLPAGEMGVFTAICDSTCGTGAGTVHMYLDGTYQGGGYYNPGQTLQGRFGPLSDLTTHTLEIDYQADGTHVAQKAIATFQVIANNLPPLVLNTDSHITLTPDPVPASESADVLVQLPCGTSCGEGIMTIDDQYVGVLIFDDTGQAGASLPSTLTPGQTHTLKVIYTGDAAYNATTLSRSVVVQSAPLPALQISTPVFSPTATPTDEYGTVYLSLNCGTYCRGGHFLIDGNYGGGYVPDSNGNATIGFNPGLVEGTHHLTVEYYGDQQYGPASPSFPFTVVAEANPPANVSITPNQPTGASGQNAVMNISVTSASGAGSCGGKGYFRVNGGYAGSFFPDGNGNAVMTTPVLTSSSYQITADYLGTTVCAPYSQSITYLVQ